MKTCTLLLYSFVLFPLSIFGQTYDTNGVMVSTFAGSEFSGYLNGTGQQTMFNSPSAIVADSHGNLFVWDSGNFLLRKITPDSTVTTFTTSGATLGNPTLVSMAIDQSDSIWMTAYKSGQPRLFQILSNGFTASILNLNPALPFPAGVCTDTYGNIYYSIPTDNRIYQYNTNHVSTVFVGSGNSGFADGNGIFTSFSHPGVMTRDFSNNIYIWDAGNGRIRRISQSRDVTTIAGNGSGFVIDGRGTNASFGNVLGLGIDSFGNLILDCGSSIRRIAPDTTVTTVAGSFSLTGFLDGTGSNSRFLGLDSDTGNVLCVSQGAVFVADRYNQRIRKITFNSQPQIIPGANLGISLYSGVTITGTVGRTYQIQSSMDMTNWTTQATLLLNASPFLWVDPAPAVGNKSYRTVLLP